MGSAVAPFALAQHHFRGLQGEEFSTRKVKHSAFLAQHPHTFPIDPLVFHFYRIHEHPDQPGWDHGGFRVVGNLYRISKDALGTVDPRVHPNNTKNWLTRFNCARRRRNLGNVVSTSFQHGLYSFLLDFFLRHNTLPNDTEWRVVPTAARHNFA
jgi:hypothetical protein